MENPRCELHFNPHEREARDQAELDAITWEVSILIHTSVKLVTYCAISQYGYYLILIHTSVKLVTK